MTDYAAHAATPAVATAPARPLSVHGGRPSSAWAGIVRRALAIVAAVVLLVFIIGPIIWMGLSAFSSQWNAPSLLPSQWTLKWWSFVFTHQELGHSFLLSVIFAVLATAFSALICLPAAYALGRRHFAGRRVILIGLFATNAFPKMGLYVSIATLFYALNLMTTIPGVVIIQLLGTVVTMTWIPAAAFGSVPPSLIEAARDAGAGPVRTFFQITLRQAAPDILIALILAFLACFDESQGTYLIGSPTYITMPTQMYSLVENYPQQAAAVFALVLCVPSVALLMAVRKHVMGGHLAEGFQIK